MSSNDGKQPDYQPNGRTVGGEPGFACGRCGCHWFRIGVGYYVAGVQADVMTECQRCGNESTVHERLYPT